MAERRTYTGVQEMADTAVGGLDPTEHQESGTPRLTPDDPTPSEENIPPEGKEHTAPDVSATLPGAGTSTSGGTATGTGTMTQGSWGVTPSPRPDLEPAPDTAPDRSARDGGTRGRGDEEKDRG